MLLNFYFLLTKWKKKKKLVNKNIFLRKLLLFRLILQQIRAESVT